MCRIFPNFGHFVFLVQPITISLLTQTVNNNPIVSILVNDRMTYNTTHGSQRNPDNQKDLRKQDDQ